VAEWPRRSFLRAIFCKNGVLAGFPEAYGLNILMFDMRKKTVEQFAIGSGEQSATFTDFRYKERAPADLRDRRQDRRISDLRDFRQTFLKSCGDPTTGRTSRRA
jgi:hypothetical protein